MAHLASALFSYCLYRDHYDFIFATFVKENAEVVKGYYPRFGILDVEEESNLNLWKNNSISPVEIQQVEREAIQSDPESDGSSEPTFPPQQRVDEEAAGMDVTETRLRSPSDVSTDRSGVSSEVDDEPTDDLDDFEGEHHSDSFRPPEVEDDDLASDLAAIAASVRGSENTAAGFFVDEE